jgi:transcriptional regulator with XRE-family HTH domain
MAAALDVRFPDLREILRFRWRQVHGLPLSLAELRRESLIESAELAEELAGLPHQFVTRLELGSRRPRSARLEALARVYGVDVSEVIGAMRRTMPEKRLSIEDLLDPADVAELVVRAEPFGGLAALFALVLRQLRQRRRREGVV